MKEEKIERVYSLDETIINATMNNSDVLGAFIKDESINMEETEKKETKSRFSQLGKRIKEYKQMIIKFEEEKK